MQNPFSLSFGKEPMNCIDRDRQRQEIIAMFDGENPSSQVCMITGVRGSGKTVMLTEVAKCFRGKEEWIVIDLTPERDLLQSFAAALSNYNGLAELFQKSKINLSFLGLGIEIDGAQPITDLGVALERMLDRISQKGRKVLVTIDEAVCNQSMREFVSMFQIYMRRDFSVFLLLTGLYENIYELQNEKTLTFLYRAPKVELQPLNIGAIASRYETIFHLEEDDALQMAKQTNGYPFAFQVLGYLCWSKESHWRDVLPEFSTYLEEYVYEKLWSELSEQDKLVLEAMVKAEDGKVITIRGIAGQPSNQFSVYRNRLLKKGIIVSPAYGCLEFALPRFREYVRREIS